MDQLGQAAALAIRLIVEGDADLYAAVRTSLTVSVTATLVAFSIGAPLGALLALRNFAARRPLLIAVNAALGLPPVVIGLVVYLLLSHAGPFGGLNLLFTTRAMISAQILLTLPIVVALAHRATEASWRDYGDALRMDGTRTARSIAFLLTVEGGALVTTFLAAFGRAISEVGAIMIVGGNIRGHTRTLTTAVVLETSKGDLALALALGLILVALTLLVSASAFLLHERTATR